MFLFYRISNRDCAINPSYISCLGNAARDQDFQHTAEPKFEETTLTKYAWKVLITTMEEYEFLWPSYRLSCLSRRITYAIGHILNDLSMPLWRSYILLYMYKVVQLSHAYVGYMVLMSLVVGALWSPLVVHQSDRRNACFCYTKRKSWHLLGELKNSIFKFPA